MAQILVFLPLTCEIYLELWPCLVLAVVDNWEVKERMAAVSLSLHLPLLLFQVNKCLKK